jgi:hypothetical protein
MSKITYLLGAGASCNALPIVKKFREKVGSFKNRLEIIMINRLGDKYKLPPRGEYAKDLMESIFWLSNIAEKHASIDTYAKKLFIKNDNEALKDLHKLKSTLSCYLLLEQSLEMTDKRYDNFFASILIRDARGIPKLPKDVNIITWNYDTQLEKSYEGFCTIPETVFEEFTRSKNIIRLNGSCGYLHAAETKHLGYTEFSISFLESVIKLYDKFMKEIARPGISFAWERSDIEDKVKQTLEGTTTLVIVGYSLPYFNREIDKMMVKLMYPTLEKVFIQAPEKDHKSFRERFLTLFDHIKIKEHANNKIEMISGIDLFYIPDDMPR